MILEKLVEELIESRNKVDHARRALEAHQVVMHLFLREHAAERDTTDAVELIRVLKEQLDDVIKPFTDDAVDRITQGMLENTD